MPSDDTILALGLMSGTSRDGIDAALITTDGERRLECGPALTRSFTPDFRQRLAGVMGGKGPDVAEVERELTLLHAEAVEALLAASGTRREAVGLIGFHGQTILHAPERRQTWQIGDGALLAELTGIDVVNDFRSRDVAEGGQGAPLVPLYHAAMVGGLARPLAVLNIGGVANLTWIGPGIGPGIGGGPDGADRLVAFDTGPGNALLDDWALRHTGLPMDRDGALARAGRVDEAVLDVLLAHPYFAQPGPKSLDRDAFPPDVVDALAPADGAATLVAFTAAAVARSVALLPAPPERWLVAGGGRRNPAIMAELDARLGVPVAAVEEIGWDGDAIEAQAFAYLAVRSFKGLPLTLPTTTGAPRPLSGGRLHHRPAARRAAGARS
jgi:anhydro-N-acetylmuramic acid kinase